MNSENRWYLILDSEDGRRQEGPASDEDLKGMLSAGNITPETLVWHEGMTEWKQIGTVPEFSQPVPEDASPPVINLIPEAPSSAESMDTTTPPESSDTVTIKEMDNHTILFSKSRNVLLITTDDYHVGPLVLTKLDLLGFLTVMETTNQEG